MKRLALTLCVLMIAGSTAAKDYIPRTDNELAFAAILEEHQAYNTRLQNVAAPILKANTKFCPRTKRDIGITVHTLSDYKPNLQPFAEVLMGASDRLSVRTVRENSPAEKAGIKTGDNIVGINGAYMPGGFTVQKFFKIATQNAYKAKQTTLEIKRGELRKTLTVRPETICDYPANVFFNENVNGHTDGKQIIVTSALMKAVSDDVNLALIIAHEMAHAIEGHQRKAKGLELKADRMALVMMTRAGYDIDEAIRYWRDTVHPHADFQKSSKTHPTIKVRYENFRTEQARIEKLVAAGKALSFR